MNYWLPPTDEERRAGFYICVEMLQLMEDVFLDFELDEYYDHVDNRGWMNLFQHWGWSGMLCATWAITGATFDPRFQRFCLHRLDLRPGVPSVADMDAAVTLPAPDEWRQWFEQGSAERSARMAEWQSRDGLNFWEAELVDKYLRASLQPVQRLFPIYVTVSSPRRSDGSPLRFNVGYIIGDIVVAPGVGAALRALLHARPEPSAEDGTGPRRAHVAPARRSGSRSPSPTRCSTPPSPTARRPTKRCPRRLRSPNCAASSAPCRAGNLGLKPEA